MVKIEIKGNDGDIWVRRITAVTKLIAALTTLALTLIAIFKN